MSGKETTEAIKAEDVLYGMLVGCGGAEKAVIDKIAAYMRDLEILASIERIQQPGATIDSVAAELLGKNDPEIDHRVCSAALEKLLAFIMEKPRGKHSYDGERPDVVRNILAAGLFGPILDDMNLHAEIKSVQVPGARLLNWFLNHGREFTVPDGLSSQRGIQTLCAAVRRFPNDKKVQEEVWSIMPSLQQRCVGMDKYPILNASLIQAGALPLAYETLERHVENNNAVHGALVVFHSVSTPNAIHSMTPSTAFLDFVREKPNFENLVERIINSHHSGGDTWHIHMEASMVQMALHGF